MPYWSLHSHSKYSAKDGMSDLKEMVARAVNLGYPALGLTDHGTMAGVVQLYNACKKAGVKPLPGVELYFTPDRGANDNSSMHLTIAAYTEEGYRNLVRLTTMTHNNFYRRPRADVADLADLHEHGYTKGLVLATGCRSGPVVRTLMHRDIGDATRVAASLAGFFDKAYIEVMNHGFTADGASDDEICAALVGIADTLGLPVIVTGDSHYVMEHDQVRHNTLKELTTYSSNPRDGWFHGCGYHLIDENWLANYLEPAVLARGLASLADLAEQAAVRIPELDTFTLRVPDITLGGNAQEQLEARVIKALTERFPDDDEHYRRAFDELAVIDEVGMAGYLLVVALITDHMTEQGVWFWARGSASCSFVNYLLGITQVDPVVDEIRMDRFLSGDRTTPPDIDLDIQSSARKEMVAWVGEKFEMRQVSIYSKYGLDENTEEQTGSLKVAYVSAERKRGHFMTKEERIPDRDWEMLTDLAQMQLVAQTGTNAAGFLISDKHKKDLAEIPLVRIGSTQAKVTAYDKDDVELLGFPKIDLLGLKMLDAMAITCSYVWPEDPVAGWNSIRDDDPSACERAGSGSTKGMFQLEGYAQRTGLEELNPKCTADIIAAQALFRPGVSKEFLGTYMRRRHGREAVPEAHPDIARELASTYGVAIFQEQVVGVLREIGMTPAALTGMLKAIKSSGKAGLVKARQAVHEALPGIIELASARGWSQDDVAWLEAALTDYGAGYSFNKGHSTIYGRVAYRTAWLGEHEPLAYWTGLLIAYTGHKDAKKQDVEKAYRNAAKSYGVTIRKAHVNRSGVHYQPLPGKAAEEGKEATPDAILTGLVSVPGVGLLAAKNIVESRPKGGYKSLQELGQAVNNKLVTGSKDLAMGKSIEKLGEGTAIRALAKANALTGLE